MDISQNDARPSESKFFSDDVAALAILIQAWWEAESRHEGEWQCAVELSYYERIGVPLDALQRLLDAGLIAARKERTGPGVRKRTFQTLAGQKPVRVCYVLTPTGASLFGSERKTSLADAAVQPVPEVMPIWKEESRELWAGGWPVRSCRDLADKLLTVVEVFQDQKWPWRIDNPLTCVEEGDPMQQLADTARALNDHQVVPLMRFHSGGAGGGFWWHWVLPRGWDRLHGG